MAKHAHHEAASHHDEAAKGRRAAKRVEPNSRPVLVGHLEPANQ